MGSLSRKRRKLEDEGYPSALTKETQMRHQPPHLTSPRALLQSMGAPIAGRGTEKDSGFAASASLTAQPSWKARFQFPLPAHRLRGGLFCLCGERLGEGSCYHLMQGERTHFLDEPNLREIICPLS